MSECFCRHCGLRVIVYHIHNPGGFNYHGFKHVARTGQKSCGRKLSTEDIANARREDSERFDVAIASR
jgi:hypothetical protein